MSIVTLFTIAKKKGSNPSAHWWMIELKKLYTHAIIYYSVLIQKDILTYAPVWMNMRILCFVKWASHRNTDIVLFHLHELLRVVRFIETESRMVVVRHWEKGGTCCFFLFLNEYRLSVLQDEKEKKSGDWLHNNVNVLNATLYLKLVER